VDVGEAEIAAAPAVREVVVVEAGEVEDGRPEVVDGAGLADRVVAVLVGRSEDGAARDAAAREPDAEAVGL